MESRVAIAVGDEQVSGLLLRPDGAKALFVFAHGAGVGMNHPSMASNAEGLAERRIATLRFQFPYMEKRSRRPDPPRIVSMSWLMQSFSVLTQPLRAPLSQRPVARRIRSSVRSA